MTEDKVGFSGWAILEIMGHRKLGGMVRFDPPDCALANSSNTSTRIGLAITKFGSVLPAKSTFGSFGGDHWWRKQRRVIGCDAA